MGAIEAVQDSAGAVTVKTYWPGGLGLDVDAPNGGETTLAWTLKERLGDVPGQLTIAGAYVEVTDQNGTRSEMLDFDPWGYRRNPSGSGHPWNYSAHLDIKGFTGHEMFDNVEIVHMNGRIYDARLGRFFSADPFVQAPENSQSYNRYTYVWNNPTNLTDPTGFCAESGSVASSIACPKDYSAIAATIFTATGVYKLTVGALRQYAANGGQTIAGASGNGLEAAANAGKWLLNEAAASPVVRSFGSVTIRAAGVGIALMTYAGPGEAGNPEAEWSRDRLAQELRSRAKEKWSLAQQASVDGDKPEPGKAGGESSNGNVPTNVGPGPNAGESVSAGPTPRPTREQQEKINEIGDRDGCHTCGTKDPGTKSGNWVGDHQDPTKLNPSGKPQRYYPQCRSCSNEQGGRLRWLPKL